jgi:hypothetical protein
MEFEQGASPKKKNPKKKHGKKNLAKSDRPTFFFFLGAPFKRYARRLWTCHRRWAPAAGCGVFLCELVPSGGPFMCCLCETFFLQRIFLVQLRPETLTKCRRGELGPGAWLRSRSGGSRRALSIRSRAADSRRKRANFYKFRARFSTAATRNLTAT